MADVLVDTDVFVDHLRGHARFDPGPDRVLYSVVTRAELFAGAGANEAVIRKLLEPFAEVPVEREIAEAAGTLRRAVGVSLPDALIGASALSRGATLLTRNRRDFDRIPGLKVRAPR
ncbi:MAG: type II toxin-antitoxin system VapC family toxin [Actinomycetota bacterium]